MGTWSCSIIMFDLDDFGQVNKLHGNLVGDTGFCVFQNRDIFQN